MEAYRLYLVNSNTGIKTGKKRDYPSLEHFRKYGIDTFKRYDRREYWTGEPTNFKAEISIYGIDNKWHPLTQEEINEITKP